MRSVIINNVEITEEEVKSMSIERIEELMTTIMERLNSLSTDKRTYAIHNKKFEDTERYKTKMVKISFAQKKLQEAQAWINVIRKQKRNEKETARYFAETFYKVACESLFKPKLKALEVETRKRMERHE